MATTLPTDLRIRAYQESDKPYLASTFLNTAHDLALFAGTPDRLYFRPMQELFDAFLRHPKSCVAVVCERGDPEVIRAWLCAWILDQTSVIWYAHTTSRRRREGICSHLVETLPGLSKASVFTSRVGHRINQKHKLVRYPTLILEVLK